MTESTDRERELADRNARLADTLREARDQMVKMRDEVQPLAKLAKRVAVGDALDYAVVAIKLRIYEIERSIHRAQVGGDNDDAPRVASEQIADIFERALLAMGYSIVPTDDAVERVA